jgi:hypothetical protein
VHIRREIRDLKNNYPDQWALYILGLREFYNDDQASPLSLYEIAGKLSLRWEYRNTQLTICQAFMEGHIRFGRMHKGFQESRAVTVPTTT